MPKCLILVVFCTRRVGLCFASCGSFLWFHFASWAKLAKSLPYYKAGAPYYDVDTSPAYPSSFWCYTSFDFLFSLLYWINSNDCSKLTSCTVRITGHSHLDEVMINPVPPPFTDRMIANFRGKFFQWNGNNDKHPSIWRFSLNPSISFPPFKQHPGQLFVQTTLCGTTRPL